MFSYLCSVLLRAEPSEDNIDRRIGSHSNLVSVFARGAKGGVKMNVGVPKESRERAARPQFGDVISLSKLDFGLYRFRFVEGVERVERIFWPMMAENEDGELESTWRVTVCPREPTILDKLAQLDRRIQVEAGVEPREVKSRLDRGVKFLYLGFDRRESQPVIRQIETGKKVYDDLCRIELSRDPVDGSKLLNAFLFMFDVDVEKWKDKSKKGWFAVSYKATAAPNNPFAGKVPASWGDTEPIPEFDYVKKGVFTEQEMAAINACDISLAEESEPDTPEELMERLREFPIDLTAMDEGKPIFYNSDALRGRLEELEEFVLGARKLLKAGTGFPPPSSPAEEAVGEAEDLFPDAGGSEPTDVSFEEEYAQGAEEREERKKEAEADFEQRVKEDEELAFGDAEEEEARVPGPEVLEDVVKEEKQSLQAKVEKARKIKEEEEEKAKEETEQPSTSLKGDEGILRW